MEWDVVSYKELACLTSCLGLGLFDESSRLLVVYASVLQLVQQWLGMER